MVGHSIAHWAAHRALLRPEGGNLGLEHHSIQSTWKGVRGAKLEDFPSILSNYLDRGIDPPDMIIIHMGTNDFLYAPLARMFALIQTAISAYFLYSRKEIAASDDAPANECLMQSDFLIIPLSQIQAKMILDACSCRINC